MLHRNWLRLAASVRGARINRKISMELKLSEAEKQIRWLRRKEELLEKVLDAICENELDGSVCSRTQAKRIFAPYSQEAKKDRLGGVYPVFQTSA